MIALDTNVLVRLIMRDDELQAHKAQIVLETQAARNDQVFVSDVVLVECVWVLRSRFKQNNVAISKVLRALLDNSTVSFQSPQAVRSAFALYQKGQKGQKGGVDFPDCLIVSLAQASGCKSTVSFDRGIKGLPAVDLL